jgi:hypothetical protein
MFQGEALLEIPIGNNRRSPCPGFEKLVPKIEAL